MLRRVASSMLIASACVAPTAYAAPADSQQPPAKAAPPKASTPEDRGVARTVHNDGARDTASLMGRSGGSLFRASLAAAPDPNQAKLKDASFFSVPEPEPRMIKKHDLVTIIIREESAFRSKGKTDTKRDMDFDARIDEWIKFNLENLELSGGGVTPPKPQIKFSGSRNFKGEGNVDRTDSLTARITGEVVDVKPNGTLVIQARKVIRNDEEEQAFILSGIARAEDVNADNTVLSTQMYDLQLEKKTKGAVRDASKRGWFNNLLDVISPF